MSNRLPRSVWIPLLTLSLVVFGWRLSTVPLTNWDEGIYANVNLELFRSHDWTKLTYFGADFLEKPPLQFWVTSLLFGILGPTELAIRFLPALAGIGTTMLVALWMYQVTKHKYSAFLAGLFFALGRFALVHAFRTGDLDGLLTFFITLAMYGYWRSFASESTAQTRKWMVVWGAASAAAVMTKSFVGALPIIIVGCDILLTRGWRTIGWKYIAWGSGVFIVLAAPWHVIETMRFGQTFWNSYFGMHVLERSTESLFTATPWYWYLKIIVNRFAPFSFFLPVALLTTMWNVRKNKNTLDRILLFWIAITLIVFSLIQTRREWYILPLYPAVAMLLASSAIRWWKEIQPRWLLLALLFSAIGAFGHLLTDNHLQLALEHFPILRELAHPFWHSVIGQLIFGIVAVSILATISALFGRGQFTRRQRMMLLGGGSMLIISLGWSLLYIRSQPNTLPLKSIAQRIEQEKIQNISLVGTLLKKQPAGYFYILRMDTHSTEYPAGTPPPSPIVLTTTEEKNVPLNTRGKPLLSIRPLLLLDLR